MNWFFIALIGPFLYAITNHIDKIVLERYFKQGGVGTLLLFSSLLSIVALPFIFWADPTVISASASTILILGVVGMLDVLVLVCYFIALNNDEASVVVVFYQLMPVFGYVLGYFILGEVLTKIQLIAMALVIFGTAIISFEIDEENKFKLKKKTILPMLGASLFWATEGVIFKAVALKEDFLRSFFWEHVAITIIGVFIFVFISSYRKHFILALKNNSKSIMALNVATEILYTLGNFAFSFAFLLAPVALVLLTQSFQPIFVLAIGIIFTIFFPKIITEKIRAKHLWPKIIAICVTGVGTYLLFMS